MSIPGNTHAAAHSAELAPRFSATVPGRPVQSAAFVVSFRELAGEIQKQVTDSGDAIQRQDLEEGYARLGERRVAAASPRPLQPESISDRGLLEALERAADLERRAEATLERRGEQLVEAEAATAGVAPPRWIVTWVLAAAATTAATALAAWAVQNLLVDSLARIVAGRYESGTFGERAVPGIYSGSAAADLRLLTWALALGVTGTAALTALIPGASRAAKVLTGLVELCLAAALTALRFDPRYGITPDGIAFGALEATAAALHVLFCTTVSGWINRTWAQQAAHRAAAQLVAVATAAHRRAAAELEAARLRYVAVHEHVALRENDAHTAVEKSELASVEARLAYLNAVATNETRLMRGDYHPVRPPTTRGRAELEAAR